MSLVKGNINDQGLCKVSLPKWVLIVITTCKNLKKDYVVFYQVGTGSKCSKVIQVFPPVNNKYNIYNWQCCVSLGLWLLLSFLNMSKKGVFENVFLLDPLKIIWIKGLHLYLVPLKIHLRKVKDALLISFFWD